MDLKGKGTRACRAQGRGPSSNRHMSRQQSPLCKGLTQKPGPRALNAEPAGYVRQLPLPTHPAPRTPNKASTGKDRRPESKVDPGQQSCCPPVSSEPPIATPKCCASIEGITLLSKPNYTELLIFHVKLPLFGSRKGGQSLCRVGGDPRAGYLSELGRRSQPALRIPPPAGAMLG